MTTGELVLRIFIWLTLIGYALGATYALGNCPPRWERRAKMIWTASCALLLLHVTTAVHVVHHWDQASVYAETARQTNEVFGVNWGGGMYVNYVLLALWIADVLWWWAWPSAYRRRPRWLVIAWHAFLLFIFFNATVVFVTGILRWLGIVGTLFLMWVWWRSSGASQSGAAIKKT